ncbi:MAG: hypothetical protein QXW35_05095 [Candidatus Aenigmatarchaeota archaeon]
MTCKTPSIPPPNYLEVKPEDSYYDLLKKLMFNYYECRSYAEKLKQANEVCK